MEKIAQQFLNGIISEAHAKELLHWNYQMTLPQAAEKISSWKLAAKYL